MGERIGFIGCGIMGRAMVKNLLRAGHTVSIFDISAEVMQTLCALGAIATLSPKEAAQNQRIIFTMLPDSSDVLAAVLGEDGVIHGANRGAVLIDCSSIDPFVSQKIHRELAGVGVDMLDAPVSGGEAKAIDATLSVMVGGEKEVLEKVKAVLDQIGASIVLCGGSGAGNITKLANQIIVAANLMVVSEALIFAKKCGVEPETVFSAIHSGLAGSAVMESKVPMMLAGNFTPGGKLAFQLKDANNVLAYGQRVGAPLPISSLVTEQMQWLCANGFALDDHSTMVHYYEHFANINLKKENE